MQNNQNNQSVQANIDEVINSLSQQIAQLSTDNAVLKSLVNQYKQQAEQTTQENVQPEDVQQDK